MLLCLVHDKMFTLFRQITNGLRVMFTLVCVGISFFVCSVEEE